MNPKVSVVIPAFNEGKYIGNCLNSLVGQKTLSYEVIVVDNNSIDDTSKIAQSFQDKINLTVVKEEKVGRGAARARGFEEARADIILSTDADTIVYQDWIETLARPIKNGTAVAVTTSCKIVDCSNFTNIIFNFLQPYTMVIYRVIFGHFWFSGFSFAILKSIYEKSGGFNPNLQVQEDLDLSFKVSKLGKIKFINKPVIFSGRRFKGSLLKGLYQYVSTFVQAFFLKKKDVFLSNVR